ncbi:Inner membrane protein YebS [compost metagenome]
MTSADIRPDQPLEALAACLECDLLMHRPRLAAEEKANCPRCGFEFAVRRNQWESRSLALVLAALIFYIPANFLPIMHFNLLGQSSRDTVWGGVVGLYETGMQGVALLVFLCSMVIPLAKLCCQLLVLVHLRFGIDLRVGMLLYRSYHHLREWGMLEVYLIGILVSIIKLIDLAELEVGIGLGCFLGLLLTQLWLEVAMPPSQVWAALGGDRG